MGAIGLIGCVGFPLLVLAAVTGIIQWTLGPLMQAARQTPTPTRFLLSDLFWLLLQLQLAMGAVAWAIPADLPAAQRIGGLLYLGVPVTLFWYACLHAVSQAGIHTPLRRAAAFVVLFPGTVLAVIALPALVVAWCAANYRSPRHGDGELTSVTLQLLVASCLVFVLRWLARWTVSPAAALAAHPPRN